MTSTSLKPRRLRQARVLAAAVLSGGLLAGCGLHDPGATYYTTTSRAVPKTAANPTPAPERGGTTPVRADTSQLAGDAASPSPESALERYANLACNWTAADVAARQQQLVNDSIGQARANAAQALTELSADHTLAANSIINRCQIVSLAAGVGHAKGQWVVVLEQSTTGGADYSNVPATLHVVYAETTHQTDGCVVNRWSAQD